MNYNFYLVDDDVSVLSILKKIIHNQNLGQVIGSALSGEEAMRDLDRLKPDIVIIDLLLPKIDGITLVRKLKEDKLASPFIMISEVSSKEMVAKAYESGIEYFIHKPINVNEVISIIKKVDEKLNMRKVIDSFQNAFHNMLVFNDSHPTPVGKSQKTFDAARQILLELGVLSEAGATDILMILEYLFGMQDGHLKKMSDFKMSELYQGVSDRYHSEKGTSVPERTIEQRIRRTVAQAMENIAELGLQDYDHPYFVQYAHALFDFKEIRREMDYIKNKSKDRGKINIRKFVTGIAQELRNYNKY